MRIARLTQQAICAAMIWGCGAQTAHALLESCDVTAVSVAFGSYDPASASPRDAVGSVTVTCQVSLLGLFSSWDISLTTGISGSYAERQLSSGAAALVYNLYVDSARTAIWGDGSPGTSKVVDSAPLLIGTTVMTYPIYGRMPAFQNEPPGTYSDSITVTLNY